jgi:hypothetical protein
MSAINVIRQRDRVVLVTDGAAWDVNAGIVRIETRSPWYFFSRPTDDLEALELDSRPALQNSRRI